MLFRTHSFARDALEVVSAMGYRSVAAVVGHDFGSMIAAYCLPVLFRGAPIGGTYRKPIDRMQSSTCTQMKGIHLIDGAGHWVQQEQPARFNALLLNFLRRSKTGL